MVEMRLSLGEGDAVVSGVPVDGVAEGLSQEAGRHEGAAAGGKGCYIERNWGAVDLGDGAVEGELYMDVAEVERYYFGCANDSEVDCGAEDSLTEPAERHHEAAIAYIGRNV